MPLDDRLFERFAMQAETMAKPDGWVDIDEVSRALDLTQEDGRMLAEFMRDNGWAKLDFQAGARLRILYPGLKEIARMRRPKWQKLMEKHWAIIAFSLGALGNITVEAIKRLIFQ